MATRITSKRAKVKLPDEVRGRRERVLRLNMLGRRRWNDTTGYPVFRTGAGGTVVIDPQYVGVWSLWRDGVTSSLLESFVNDKGVTALKYVHGWTARETPMGLAWGTMMHDVLYGLYELFPGLSHDAIMAGIAEPKGPIEDELSAYDAKWRARNPDPSTEGLQTHYSCLAYARAVLPSYIKRWIGDFTGKYSFMENTAVKPASFISTEKEFRVPYVYPDGMCVWLRGKRDLVFRDKDGEEWIQDTKCLSQINDREIIRFAPIDQQQNIYMYARLIEGVRAGRGFDAMPMGNVKNIIRRPGEKRKEGEDFPAFMARVRGNVSDMSKWDVKDKKGTTGYFVRYMCQMPESELLDWAEGWLDPLMMELRMWYEGTIPNYTTQKGLSTKYGPSDMFAAIAEKNFNNLYVRDKPFPELD